MRKPRTAQWKNIEGTQGLLLIAQRMEEALFDYSTDSLKVPTLNTHTRCVELRSSVMEVKGGQVTDKSLHSIIEELAWSLEHDPAAKALLGPLHRSYRDPSWWDQKTISRLSSQVDTLYGRLRHGRYEGMLIEEIRIRLADADRKAELLNLCASLIVEWLHRGFSKGYIFRVVRATFFNPTGSRIEDLEAFDSFVSKFSHREPIDHEVLLRIDATFLPISEILPPDIVPMNDPPPARTTRPKERGFLDAPHSGSYLLAKGVKALDPRSAVTEATRKVAMYGRLAMYHAHKNWIAIDGNVLVYPPDEVVLLRPTPSAVHREVECADEELVNSLATTFSTFISGKNSEERRITWTRLLSALGLHAAAAGASDASVQLTALWSGIEALLPVTADQIKINVVLDNLIPVLSRRYPLRLIDQLESDFKTCCPKEFEAVLADVPDQVPERLRCAALVSIPSNKPLRLRLYAALDSNPLLKHRLYELASSTASGSAVRALVDAHRRKVEWHLRRIYRCRNLVTHAGRVLSFLPSLVENLHTYFHRLVDSLQECFASPAFAPTMDAALVACQLDDQRHMQMLKELEKEETTAQNLVDLLVGPSSLSLTKTKS